MLASPAQALPRQEQQERLRMAAAMGNKYKNINNPLPQPAYLM